MTEVDYRGGQMLYSLADSRRAILVDDRILNAAAVEDEDGAARCRDAGASGGHGAFVAE